MNNGGAESQLTPEQQARSRQNNSREAWLAANGGKLPGKLFETGLSKVDIIDGHERPTPWWVYRITTTGYDFPHKCRSLEEAIAWATKYGYEVAAINPFPCTLNKNKEAI